MLYNWLKKIAPSPQPIGLKTYYLLIQRLRLVACLQFVFVFDFVSRKNPQMDNNQSVF